MIIFFILLVSLFTSCATIINGPDQKVTVLSEPAGADITINGVEAGKTPATFRIIRSKDHVIALTKEGYHQEIAELKRALSGVAVLYLLPGGLLSMAVDASEGTLYSFPDKVDLALKRLFDPGKVLADHMQVLKNVTQEGYRELRQ